MKIRNIKYISSKISWFVIGIMFIISAMFKWIDIFDFSAQIKDYAEIIGIGSITSLHLYEIAAVGIIGIELTLGLCICLGICRKYVYWISVSLLNCFLLLTFLLLITNEKSDCGCFGRIWTLSPGLSFLKNIILLVIIYIAYPQSKLASRKSKFVTVTLMGCVIVISGYSLYRQPIYDTNLFKKGSHIDINISNAESIQLDFMNSEPDLIETLIIVKDFNEVDDLLIDELIEEFHLQKLVLVANEIPNLLIDRYPNLTIGMADNSEMSKLLSVNIGVFKIKDEMVIHKWQQDYLSLQKYQNSE